MFRVEVYPEGYKSSTWKPSLVVHTCFSAPDDRILTIGRKTGEVMFSEDRSVSREHAILSLVATNNSSESGTKSLVVNNVGKLGTFIVEEAKDVSLSLPSSTVNENVDSDATDDDEGDSPQNPSSIRNIGGYAVKLSRISLHLASTNASVRVVGPKESKTLPNHSKTILQFGKLGSTIIITPLKFRIIRVSGKTGKQSKPALFEHAEEMGIEDLQNIALTEGTVTHVVTKSRNASPNQIAAWAMGIPIITNDYWKALWGRKEVTDPIPAEADYPPTPDNSNFWEKETNKEIWSNSIFLAVKEDDLINLVAGGGAHIVKLWEFGEDGGLAHGTEILRNDKLKPACFVSDTRRTVAKKLIQLGAAKVLPKELAKFLTEQDPITFNGRLVEGDLSSFPKKSSAMDDTVGQVAKVGNDSSANLPVAARETKGKRPRTNPSDAEKVPAASTSKRAKKSSDLQRKSHHGTETAEVSREVVSQNKRNLSDQELQVDMGNKRVPAGQIQDPSPKPKTSDSFNSKKVLTSSEDVVVEDDAPLSPSETIEATSQDHGESEAKENDRRSKRTESALDEDVIIRPAVLDKPKNGWFSAAPKGTARRKVANRVVPSSESEFDEYPDVITEVAESLVQTTTQKKSSGRKQNSGPDFKGFRKNRVPRCNEPAIRLTSVLPKEAERDQKEQEEIDALHEQHRKADELFRDPGNVAARRRGRK